jgi:phosphatidylethanolamine N-methyltransferase
LASEDDFVLYSVDDAEHIAYAIRVAFGVDLTAEVVVAAANVGKLAKQVGEARKLLNGY